jgi:peptide deformylase
MTRRAILEYPDPRLRTRAEPVTDFGAELQTLVDDLLETLRASRALGLAATQVDDHRRVLVVDVSGIGAEPQVFINPEIVDRSGLGMVEEGCLSVPGVHESVRRALSLTVRADDRAGHPYERRVEGMLAVCLQHEMDHLEGRLFVDRLPWYKRIGLKRRLARARRGRNETLPSDAPAPT